MSELKDRIAGLSATSRAALEKKLLERSRASSRGGSIRRRNDGEPSALSFAQHRLWFLDQLSPGSPTYNVPYWLRIEGALDEEALGRALHAFVGRHEALRTRVVPLRGNAVPLLSKVWASPLRCVDLREATVSDRDAEAMRLIKEEAARPFDLARDVLLRCALFRVSEDAWLMCLVSHHITWDLRSKVIFFAELGPLYEAARGGGDPAGALPPLAVQYADYALWQKRRLTGEPFDALVRWWKEQLEGAPPALLLPLDKPRPSAQSLRGAKLPVSLPAGLIERVKLWSRKSGATPYMTLLAAFELFLFTYTGAEDIVIGSPTAGRTQVEAEGVVGFFINTLVLRTRLDGSPSFRALLARVRETTLGALLHQELPFDKLVEALRPPRDLSRMALFQVNFRVQAPALPPLEAGGLRVSAPEIVDNDTSKFDLALELPMSASASGYFEYSTDLFEEATIARMRDDFTAILAEALASPEAPITELPSVRAVRARLAGKPLA